MNGQPPNDELLLTVFLLACAFLGIFYLVDLWRDYRVSDVWRTVYADWRERRAERRARKEVDGLSARGVVIRIRDVWEAKR
jgi:hypothetical protein